VGTLAERNESLAVPFAQENGCFTFVLVSCVHGFHGVELGMRMISVWARLRREMSRWRYLKRRMSFADDRAWLPTESKVVIEQHGRLDFGRS
jgi:hypothetical protein